MIVSPHTVEDLMSTALLTVEPSAKIRDAITDMEAASVRHLVVVEPGNRLAGIISSKDLGHLRRARELHDDPVSTHMTRVVYTVQASDSAAAAGKEMLRKRIGALPVAGEDGQLVGIVTVSDYVRLACEMLEGNEDE